jgi:uncharacterized membrane protein
MRKVLRHPEAEQGSVLVLMLGFAVVAVLLVAAVTDASALFLTRRSLAGSADGAAIAAVQELDREAFYTGPAGEALPLDPDQVLDAVRVYVSAAQLDERYEGFEVVEVRTDAESVTVTFRATLRLPFLGAFAGQADGVEIEATATARAPYVD